MEDGVEGVAWRDTEQVTTLVSLSLQGELGLPGPTGVPGLIVSTQMPGEENGQEGECGLPPLSYPLKGRIQRSAPRMKPLLMESVLRAQISQEAHRASFLA